MKVSRANRLCVIGIEPAGRDGAFPLERYTQFHQQCTEMDEFLDYHGNTCRAAL